MLSHQSSREVCHQSWMLSPCNFWFCFAHSEPIMKIALGSLCLSLLLSFTPALLAQDERVPHAQDKPPGPALSPA